MPFINEITQQRSLSIVGLEKNTGKTVCLNYILRRLAQLGHPVAVTSIGVDGEQTDAVFGTAKPEIVLYPGTKFITSEVHYRKRRLLSNILDVDERRTSLGKLITAEVLNSGKVLLSGAATTEKLRQQISQFRMMDVPLTIVDGALSRISLASPTVTDAMILATGAAVSPNLQQLISKTRFLYRLINLPEVEPELKERLLPLTQGLWSVDAEGEAHDLHIASALLLDRTEEDIFRYGNTLYASGSVSDRLLKHLASRKQIRDIVLIARDFTKFFVTPEVYVDFTRRGGTICVLQRSKLIAVTLNPTSPHGYTLRSEEACAALSEALQIPVYDVMKTLPPEL